MEREGRSGRACLGDGAEYLADGDELLRAGIMRRGLVEVGQLGPYRPQRLLGVLVENQQQHLLYEKEKSAEIHAIG